MSTSPVRTTGSRPIASLDDIVADCRRAIGFLHRERKASGIGAGPMVVTGHSAAGQLAAVMASTDWPEFDTRLPARLLRGLVGVSGFYDIEPFHETGFQSQTLSSRKPIAAGIRSIWYGRACRRPCSSPARRNPACSTQ